MIEVRKLSKVFDRGVVALCGVSFTARPGQVLGFLGQNGAGKTTAMRILAGYLRPSAGSASICGHDVCADSMAARRALGYLPEHVPLYDEMRVSEYLRYRAALRGLGERQRRVEEAMETTGLMGHGDRIIDKLSKGYRKRVGLADALLHRPSVLVLDEPTDGLDPNQRRDTLGLIAALGRERTVVLSTHVLPEVETVCQRVVILDQGQVVAEDDTLALLARLRATDRVELSCRAERARLLPVLEALPHVSTVSVERDEDDVLHLLVQLDEEGARESGAALERLARAALSVGELRHLALARSSLDSVFRLLTREAPQGGGEAG